MRAGADQLRGKFNCSREIERCMPLARGSVRICMSRFLSFVGTLLLFNRRFFSKSLAGMINWDV